MSKTALVITWVSSAPDRRLVSEIGVTAQTKGHGHEDPDGYHLSRQARQHRPKDRLLARGARRTVLCVQGLRCAGRARLAERRSAAARSEEQRAELPDRADPPVRGRFGRE